ncbi:ornithine carbamoyltransferase [Alkalispirochaeta sphaeroplastigenens]|nr:ornithine carbamoyltransferase [Alkalispirochaeta sphaeroplastigenens]
MKSLEGRSLLALMDFTPEEIRYLLDLAHRVKQEQATAERPQRFRGRTLAMLFEKRSTRTRAAFETAFGEEGGHPVFLSSADIQLGAKETIEDTARVLGRMFDIIEFRGFCHKTVEKLARHAGVPVMNGLTDQWHPTQALADLLTIEEHTGALEGVVSVYCGDGRNNVSNSLLVGAAAMGLHHHVICPRALAPDPDLLAAVAARQDFPGTVTVHTDLESLPPEARVIYTDVWVSMGEEGQEAERKALLSPFQVTDQVMAQAPEAIFLHCLPAVRGNEMTATVIDGPASRVWDQAENRKHTIKAVMLASLGLA